MDEQAEKARKYFSNALEAYMRENPGASVEEVRKFTLDLFGTVLPNFTDLTGTLACDLFDEIAEECGFDGERARLYDTTDYSVVEDKVRYFAGFLADEDQERFKREVADVTRYFCKRAAFDNMVENCRAQKVKWARMPTGFETCPFCFMLASRGFVYASEKTASEGHHGYHDNCDCVPVPGFQDAKDNPRVKIDGYDPETMYRNWSKCEKSIGGREQARAEWLALSEEVRQDYIERHGNASKAFARFEENRIRNEVATRDWHWLYTGESPRVDYSKAPRSDYGILTKPGDYREENIKNPGVEWRDLFAHDSLSANGIRIETRPKLKRSGVSDIDLLIDGHLVEVKSPSGGGERQVKNAFTSATNQFDRQGDTNDPIRIVFNGYYSGKADEWISSEIDKRMRTMHGIYEVIQINKDGSITRHKNTAPKS